MRTERRRGRGLRRRVKNLRESVLDGLRERAAELFQETHRAVRTNVGGLQSEEMSGKTGEVGKGCVEMKRGVLVECIKTLESSRLGEPVEVASAILWDLEGERKRFCGTCRRRGGEKEGLARLPVARGSR